MNDKTFYLNMPCLNEKIIYDTLIDNNFITTKKAKETYVIIIGTSNNIIRYFKKYTPVINNKSNNDVITNKYQLYTLFTNTFMPKSKTYLLFKDTIIKYDDFKEGPLIIKPAIGYRGVSIYIVNNQNELDTAVNTIYNVINNKKRSKRFNVSRNTGIVLSKYINNPMLISGFKFHILIYMFLFCNTSGIKRAFISNMGRIITTSKKYIQDEYDNKSIHDSHIRDKKKYYYFPDDYEEVPEIKREEGIIYTTAMKQIINICKTILNKTKNKIIPYQEYNYCYDILGLDFLPDDTGSIYLLEINYKIDINNISDKLKDNLSHNLANIIVNKVNTDYSIIIQ